MLTNKELEFLLKEPIVISSYLYNNKIIETNNNKYIIKYKNKDLESIYNYLDSKSFINYIKYIYEYKNYYIFPFFDDFSLNMEDKSNELIKIISSLHNKTKIYESIYEDEINKIYSNYSKRITDLEEYYDNLRKRIEEEYFINKCNYNYLYNCSWIFRSLDSSKLFLDKWKNILLKKKEIRKCFIHGNLSINHIIVNKDNYLISWDNSKFDYPMIDLIKLYYENYNDLDMYNLFNLYEEKNILLEEEKYYIFFNILIPKKVEELNKYNQEELFNYLVKTNEFISKYHSKDTNS